MTWAVLTVVLLVVGCALLAVEIFVIPGFGVVGLLGLASVLGAAVVAWTQLGPTWGIAAFGGGVGVVVLLFWLFPRTSAGKALVLGEAHRGKSAPAGLGELLGKPGKAVTPLRPAGIAEIEARTVDVVTDGVYVEAGTRLRVVRVEGTRVVVEPAETSS